MQFDDKPMGYWTRRHIATDPRWTKYYAPISLGPRLSAPEPGFPKLEPALRAASQYLYSPTAVGRFFDELEAWVSGTEARAAARKAEVDAAAARALAQEQAALKLRREIAEGEAYVQASLAKRKAEDEARRQRIFSGGSY